MLRMPTAVGRAAPLASVHGEPLVWRQAEPCRHWQCGQCAVESQAQGMGGFCHICCQPVVKFEVGVSLGAME